MSHVPSARKGPVVVHRRRLAAIRADVPCSNVRIDSVDVGAVAVAEVLPANAATCLKPWPSPTSVESSDPAHGIRTTS